MISKIKLSEIVGDNEETTRYLFSRSHYNTKRAKWAGFEPNNGEVSVFRTDEVTEDEKKEIGIWVQNKRNEGKQTLATLKAWVCFKTIDLRKLEYPDTNKMKLDVIYEPSSHIHHANIKDLSKQNQEDWLDEAKILAEKLEMIIKII
jgi:hypothetical protein